MMSITNRRISVVTVLVIIVTALHYTTNVDLGHFHDIFRRLYYLPILFAGFWFGLRGGVFTALLVSILYAPHVVFQWGHHPSMELEQYLEILLYNVIGFVIGFLSSREKAQRLRFQHAAEKLETSYGKLREQADLILEIEDQLRRADRLTALGELSAGMAHEIRNPLGSIKGTAEIFRDAFPPEDKRHEFAGILLREVDRLNGVVQDFLDFVRPKRVEQKFFNLDLLVEETRTFIEPQLKKAQIDCIFEAGVGGKISGCGEQIKQVLLNLLLNAIDATPTGGKITVSTKDAGIDKVVLQVVDSGVGVPVENVEKIFNPFFTTRSEGTGLGLAIVHRIVASHGGTIVARRNEPESGMTFLVELPKGCSAE